jgi:hypothetical protein
VWRLPGAGVAVQARIFNQLWVSGPVSRSDVSRVGALAWE